MIGSFLQMHERGESATYEFGSISILADGSADHQHSTHVITTLMFLSSPSKVPTLLLPRGCCPALTNQCVLGSAFHPFPKCRAVMTKSLFASVLG